MSDRNNINNPNKNAQFIHPPTIPSMQENRCKACNGNKSINENVCSKCQGSGKDNIFIPVAR